MKPSEMFELSGQVAFVTGAASGLGLAMSEVLALNGATVVMADINEHGLESVGKRLRGAGFKVEIEPLDVCDLAALERSIAKVAERLGRLDILCANAGLSAGPGPLTEAGGMAKVDLGRWDELLRINLTSVFVSVRTAAAQMRRRKYGRIIVTSSIAGLRGERLCGYGYVTTKAAVANLVRQASLELASEGVTVNAVAPGPFLTNIGNGRLHDAETASAFSATVPMKRIAHPDEIKGLTLLLASRASSFMTGTVIPVDGGSNAV
ncbi:SDR family NAD(P)-dependent oxidoreductase [Bradyrhizobium liaoningense]